MNTEAINRVETQVEKKIDSLDRRYLDGQLTRAEYESVLKEIDLWAKNAISEIMKGEKQ